MYCHGSWELLSFVVCFDVTWIPTIFTVHLNLDHCALSACQASVDTAKECWDTKCYRIACKASADTAKEC